MSPSTLNSLTIAAAPLGEWEDIVCRATIGMTAAAALA